MTLIAAFRCVEGAILCADQQETVGGVRVAVNKLAPRDCGHYQLAIAGSGDGDLIEGFSDSYARLIQTWPAGLDEATARHNTREFLLDFHANEIALYPSDSAGDKLNHFLVCIKPNDSTDLFLWELRGSVIVSVGDYTLMGVGAAIYKHEIKKLYRGMPRKLQAMLLGIHLFSLAKETSNYVGGQTDVISVSDTGMKQESAEDVAVLERRVAMFNERIAELVLLCPDSTIHDDAIMGRLSNFMDEVIELRSLFTGSRWNKPAVFKVTNFHTRHPEDEEQGDKLDFREFVPESSEPQEPEDNS